MHYGKINYPRHVRVSSDIQTVADMQDKLRRNKVFRDQFDPELNSAKNQVIYNGVYLPNK